MLKQFFKWWTIFIKKIELSPQQILIEITPFFSLSLFCSTPIQSTTL